MGDRLGDRAPLNAAQGSEEDGPAAQDLDDAATLLGNFLSSAQGEGTLDLR